MFDKKIVAYFLSILISTGTYAFWNLKEQRKLTKRINRNEAFLAESEALRLKYPNEPADGGKEMVNELLSLMKKYDLS